jgi:hypothetical protein
VRDLIVNLTLIAIGWQILLHKLIKQPLSGEQTFKFSILVKIFKLNQAQKQSKAILRPSTTATPRFGAVRAPLQLTKCYSKCVFSSTVAAFENVCRAHQSAAESKLLQDCVRSK